MRHRNAGRKLGRNASHRLALYRNLALALFRHERIITTEQKAKAVRPFIERLITLAKKDTLHARRLIIARLGPVRNAEVRPPDPNDNDDEGDLRTIVQKLFQDIGPRFKERPGGYTRVVKRHERRLGDGGKTAFLELLKEGETKVRAKKAAPAPAPKVEEPGEQAAPETPAPQAQEPAPAPEAQQQAPAPEGTPPAPQEPPKP